MRFLSDARKGGLQILRNLFWKNGEIEKQGAAPVQGELTEGDCDRHRPARGRQDGQHEGKVREGRNGGGDPWHTDGKLYVGVIAGL
jgi:hypothetical protein